MKKLLTVLLCFVILSGCEKKKDVKTEPLIFSGFACTVTTELNDVVITSSVIYDCAGGFEFTVLSPETLRDIKVSGKDGTFTLSGEGLTLETENKNLMPACIFRALSDCVSSVLGSYPVEIKNGERLYAYKCGDVTGALKTDENGIFRTLTVNGKEFTFESFSFAEK